MPKPLATLAPITMLVSLLAACAQPAVLEEARGTTASTLLTPVKAPLAMGGTALAARKASHTAPSTRRARGAKLTHRAATPAARGSMGASMARAGTTVPASADLSSDAPVAGDQQQTGACATFSTGYSAMGWWAKKTGLAGAPYAPMFLYAQQVRGNCDDGTSLEDNLAILQQEGIPSDDAYQPMQDRLDCATQPSRAAIASAAGHRIAASQALDLTNPGTSIRQALAAGYPVVIAMETFNALDNVSEQSFVVDAPQEGETSEGGHAVTLFGYDETGAWFLNSWGESWGYHGWAMLTWAFLEGATQAGPNLDDAQVITGLTP